MSGRGYEPDLEVQSAMAGYLERAVVGDATGEADGDRCAGEPPSVRYYLGTLAPLDIRLPGAQHRRGKETANSLGMEFEVTDPGATVELRAVASCYYKVFPTLDEQLRFDGGRDDPAVRHGREYRLAPVFRRVEVDSGPIRVQLEPGRPLVKNIGLDELAREFQRVQTAAAGDPEVERRAGEDRSERRVPGHVLTDERLFAQWLAELEGTPVTPEWRASMTLLARPAAGGKTRVVVSFENLSEDPTVAARRPRRGSDRRHDDARDHFLFRARMEVAATAGVITPIEMDLGPDAYRYDPELPAYANNCGVKVVRDKSKAIVRLISTPAPVHETYRAVSIPHPSCGFDVLAGKDALPALRTFATDMRAYLGHEDWDTSDLERTRRDLAERKRQDRTAFDLEVRRFEDGIRWMERDPRLLLAFRLANRTMIKLGEMSRQRHPGWHRFQLVFIVSQLPALAWREHDPAEFTAGLWGDPGGGDPTGAATVLWYPTGGGKTEGYLGLMATAMFYDRARGKRRGVTAWCRLPLRLLALQQTQRQLDLVAAAEEVRQRAFAELRAVGGDPGDPFAIGFFAGGANTPNSLSRDGVLERMTSDPARRRKVRLVDECPYCRERAVEVDPPEATTIRLLHRCNNPRCGRVLPLHIVDTEIYRYLPAVVVGTLDKLANIGLSDQFGALLGDVDCECTLHGFGRGEKCFERRVTGHPRPEQTIRPLAEPLYDAAPSLEIVDELHMVREELGAFSGHYEGLLAHVQGELGARTRPDGRHVRAKVLATTATIRGEDRQCDHLFGLRSVVVPLPGPSLRRSFYWEIDDKQPLRRFVGVMPNRSTVEQSLVRILQALHAAVRRAEEGDFGGDAVLGALTNAERADLIDLYKVVLTYLTSLVDFGKLRRSMETQVNKWLRDQAMNEVAVRALSGDVDFDEVRATLDDLMGSGETEQVVATSTVSHGVDVPRLNLMVFNGMPKAMNEYIQASSRVGRQYLGVVFLLYNAVRERDRSHFRYHGKFHEYLDRMVEPVAINRWSRFAARRTLPGVLMGEILQSVNRAWWDTGHAPGHLHDLDRMKVALRPPGQGGLAEAQQEALLEAMKQTYDTSRAEAAELRADVELRVGVAVSSIRSAGAAAAAAGGGRSRYRGTGDYLGLESPPMTSLRDVADGLPFYTLQERRRP
jgi:hypothetical protein